MDFCFLCELIDNITPEVRRMEVRGVEKDSFKEKL